ncbi:SDR family oxidoreductase [Larkinella soli]|uniref:SDR family oxidoreductase n=1 Tax=Larkinella soli TaxID=1770527 RepID=UPI000FFC956B|nr:SDR family oxidoreductase [Larkinella soli]
MAQKILVTGATGTIGRPLVRQLQHLGASFVAGVRQPEKAAETLGLSADRIVSFDFSDPATFAGAVEGVDRIFLLGPPLRLDLTELVAPFIDFLRDRGIRRVVYLSALREEKMGDQLNFHSRILKKLENDGFETTVLRPTFFAQNFRNFEWENITLRGITYVPAGTGRVAFVDAEDIAAVAAAALTQEGHIGKTYELTGPESLTHFEAADRLTEVTGRTVVYPNPSPEEYTETLRASGAPDFIAPYMITAYSLVRNHLVDLVTSDVEKVTGRKPTSLKTVLEREFQSVLS